MVGILGYAGLSEITAWTRGALASTEESLTVSWITRKVSHVVLFGVLGLLAESSARPGTRRVTLAVGLSVCLLAELLQNYATGRSAESRDVLINMTAMWGIHLTQVATRCCGRAKASTKKRIPRLLLWRGVGLRSASDSRRAYLCRRPRPSAAAEERGRGLGRIRMQRVRTAMNSRVGRLGAATRTILAISHSCSGAARPQPIGCT